MGMVNAVGSSGGRKKRHKLRAESLASVRSSPPLRVPLPAPDFHHFMQYLRIVTLKCMNGDMKSWCGILPLLTKYSNASYGWKGAESDVISINKLRQSTTRAKL
jgi:hypothetical protein